MSELALLVFGGCAAPRGRDLVMSIVPSPGWFRPRTAGQILTAELTERPSLFTATPRTLRHRVGTKEPPHRGRRGTVMVRFAWV
jgi:hypothetical protein